MWCGGIRLRLLQERFMVVEDLTEWSPVITGSFTSIGVVIYVK